MAEFFRDDEHRDVLLLIDNIFRFIQAGMEVSGLMGQMPSRLGYQPTMGTELPGLEERTANTDSGAITSIQAVYVPADDLTDPAAVHTFSHLSASIVLSRKRASEGLYPAIDLLQSNSKMATPAIIGQRHYLLAQEIRKTLAHYKEIKDIIAMLGIERLFRILTVHLDGRDVGHRRMSELTISVLASSTQSRMADWEAPEPGDSIEGFRNPGGVSPRLGPESRGDQLLSGQLRQCHSRFPDN